MKTSFKYFLSKTRLSGIILLSWYRPGSTEGQKEFPDEVNKIVLETPGNLGRGIFWWEPATFGGRSTRDFFDENGNVLPVITVFDKYTRH